MSDLRRPDCQNDQEQKNKLTKYINIRHLHYGYAPDPDTEILIIGTFNPGAKSNKADFFYGRPKNHLWTLLTTSFKEHDLKAQTKEKKIGFIRKHKIDFTDLISAISIPHGSETDYRDSFIDDKVTEWNDIISIISDIKNLKKVCFTRKTFSDIPNIKRKIEEVREYCETHGIIFKNMITPARIYSKEKQEEWSNFIL